MNAPSNIVLIGINACFSLRHNDRFHSAARDAEKENDSPTNKTGDGNNAVHPAGELKNRSLPAKTPNCDQYGHFNPEAINVNDIFQKQEGYDRYLSKAVSAHCSGEYAALFAFAQER